MNRWLQRRRERKRDACTCRWVAYTFDSACPVHGDGTLHEARREALARGDWQGVDELDREIAAEAFRAE